MVEAEGEKPRCWRLVQVLASRITSGKGKFFIGGPGAQCLMRGMSDGRFQKDKALYHPHDSPSEWDGGMLTEGHVRLDPETWRQTPVEKNWALFSWPVWGHAGFLEEEALKQELEG